MNLYFILEGDKTEVIVYPLWIKHVLPHFSQIDFEHQAKNNNYYIFSGGGIPSIYNHTVNAIKNINDNPIFEKLIVCLDGEEIGAENRINEIKKYIEKTGIVLVNTCNIEFIVQNICIETWFLGNRKIVKRAPSRENLREFLEHYNVTVDDPEEMEKIGNYRNKAHFHHSYFKEILMEHGLTYKKSNPKIVQEKYFFQELTKRVNDTNHIPSFKKLLDLLYTIKHITTK